MYLLFLYLEGVQRIDAAASLQMSLSIFRLSFERGPCLVCSLVSDSQHTVVAYMLSDNNRSKAHCCGVQRD